MLAPLLVGIPACEQAEHLRFTLAEAIGEKRGGRRGSDAARRERGVHGAAIQSMRADFIARDAGDLVRRMPGAVRPVLTERVDHVARCEDVAASRCAA